MDLSIVGVPDEELVRAARAGDVAAFVMLTERHRAAMRATAVALLGYVDEVDDAMQDAMLLAFRRLPQLRDPASVGAWLKAIIRNVCRGWLRLQRPVPVAEPRLLLPSAGEPGPEETVDRGATRDWMWHALNALSTPIREAMVLRYFTRFSSYQHIAQLCGVGVDTVGGRLRDGRRALAGSLRESAGDAYASADAEAAWYRRQAEHLDATLHDGSHRRVIEDWCRPDMSVVVLGGLAGDRSTLLSQIETTSNAGVETRLHDAVGSRDVIVWEKDFLNPPDDPEHCPPRTAWLLRLRDGKVARLGIAYGTTARG
ncbi:RNA polymerase sigma factor [Dactylosporangium sp. CA-092794]|uniref:RNA polymerase sigma factor n=1 Tax=Dactylosporangium sp. CA-092794 TaxID=3239929 RepID=UPI003D91E482